MVPKYCKICYLLFWLSLLNYFIVVTEPPNMPIFNRSNGISIYYELIDETNNTGELCILIGGLTRDTSVWRKMIPLLKNDYQIIVLDNRDAGQSTAVNNAYDITDMAEDVADLMRGLQLSPAHIIGHSMGGFIAIHLAAKYPALVKTLVLCSTAEKQVAEGIEYLKSRIRLIESQPNEKATTASKENIMAVMDKLYAPESLQNSEFVEEIISHETKNKYPQSRLSFKRQAQACVNHDASHLISAIHCPVLIVTGESDKYYTPALASNLAAKFQNSFVQIIVNAAHMIQIEQPEVLSIAIRNFIEILEEAPEC